METNAPAIAATESTYQNFFTGSVPYNYDTYMGPVLFTPYAIELAQRMNATSAMQVLELAAGTGRVTKEIISRLPADSQLTATDISGDMLAIAKEKLAAAGIRWEVADMMQLSYKEDSFDVVICGFGLMFVQDKVQALQEMRRVLKPGGQLLLTTWGNMAENPMWQAGFDTLVSFLGSSPFPKDASPFSLPDAEVVLHLIRTAGFLNPVAEAVRKTSFIKTAAYAAESFLKTSPALAKNPALLPPMQASLTQKLSETLGDEPMPVPLLALVFEAIK